MTTATARPEPKVYYDRDRQALVGPLGYWKVGDTIELPAGTYHVGSVDLDGAAVCWKAEYLASLAGDASSTRGRTVEAVLASLRDVHTGKPVLELTPNQIRQCKAIAGHGERLRAEHDAAISADFDAIIGGGE